MSFRGIIFHHTSCANGRLPYVGVNDWPRPVHGTMTSIVPYKLFAAFAAIGKVSPQRDEGIPPYRTVNDGFIIMLQISPAATSPDSMHWARAVS